MSLVSSHGVMPPSRPRVLSIGVFDGVHRGHQYVLRVAAEEAERLGAEVTVVSFWPPPLAVLRPDVAIHTLMTGEEKREALADLPGVAHVRLEPFTPEIAAMSAEAFLARLRDALPVVGLVEGDDFVLGHNRTGTLDWLRDYGAAAGLRVVAVTRQVEDGAPISSTRIRALIEAGDVATATTLLGRPYQMRGEVVHGDARGRSLGYPTANLRLDPIKLMPANGVYAVRAWRRDTPGVVWLGAANVGVRPMFGGVARRVETYLLDVAPDLYGAVLCVEFARRLREERLFPSVEALVDQMALDVAATRAALASRETRSA